MRTLLKLAHMFCERSRQYDARLMTNATQFLTRFVAQRSSMHEFGLNHMDNQQQMKQQSI